MKPIYELDVDKLRSMVEELTKEYEGLTVLNEQKKDVIMSLEPKVAKAYWVALMNIGLSLLTGIAIDLALEDRHGLVCITENDPEYDCISEMSSRLEELTKDREPYMAVLEAEALRLAV